MSAPENPMARAKTWNLVASDYVEDVVPQLEPFAVDAIELAGSMDGARIIDVACGPGTLALLAAPRAKSVDAYWSTMERSTPAGHVAAESGGRRSLGPHRSRFREGLVREFGTGAQCVTLSAWLGVGRTP
jgi:hypothetical protein